jgi:hypothetical protein
MTLDSMPAVDFLDIVRAGADFRQLLRRVHSRLPQQLVTLVRRHRRQVLADVTVQPEKLVYEGALELGFVIVNRRDIYRILHGPPLDPLLIESNTGAHGIRRPDAAGIDG